MPVLQIYLDPRPTERLTRAGQALGRSIEDLAEAAVSEAALAYERPQSGRPAQPPLRFQTPEGSLTPASPEGGRPIQTRGQP